jgi:hypothetical protein
MLRPLETDRYFDLHVGLTWIANTFEILALASRAFALYCLLQSLVAINLSQDWRQKSGMSLIASVLAFIFLFAVPAGDSRYIAGTSVGSIVGGLYASGMVVIKSKT